MCESVVAAASTTTTPLKRQHCCPFCERSFTRPYRLNDHISFSHTDERKYMCSLCSKYFSCKDKLKHHIDVKHENKQNEDYNKTSNNNNNNNNNISSNSPKSKTTKNTQNLKCIYPECTKLFANKYNVKRHVENVHKRKRNDNNDDAGDNDDNNNDDDDLDDDDDENDQTNPIKISSSDSIAESIACVAKAICNNHNNNHNHNNNQTTKLEPITTTTTTTTTSHPRLVINSSAITLTNLGLIHQQHQLNQQQQSQFAIYNNPNNYKSEVDDLLLSTNANEPITVEQFNAQINNLHHHQTQNSSLHQQHSIEQQDDEKSAKIYTCARCPEIFSSSLLLRKHVSESHEKGFLLYNLWGN
jgi:uncharacterized Zn-finger protein